MHKPFYASGFFYHSPTHQILLRQNKSDDTEPLTLIRAKGTHGEEPLKVFHKAIKEAFGISLDAKEIVPIYDYVHDQEGPQFIFYVEIPEKPEHPKYTKKNVGWFPLAKLSKLKLSEQTRHDIIVGERVIRSSHEPENKHAPRP